MGGGHQAAHIDRCGGTEIDAIRVAQEHLAVRSDAAENLARLRIENPVQGDGAGRRLGEIDAGLGTEIKRLPIDRPTRRALLDVHRRAILRDNDLAANDLRAGRQLGRRGRRREGAHAGAKTERREGRSEQSVAVALTFASGAFRHGDPGAKNLAPDQSVNTVHGRVHGGTPSKQRKTKWGACGES